jgi:hypothetical protein
LISLVLGKAQQQLATMDADLSVHYLNLLLEINGFQLNKAHLPNPFHRTHIFATWSQNPLY